MSSFSAVEKRRPTSEITLPPEAFGELWEDRPKEPVRIGLRFVVDADLEDARIEAFRRAEKLFPKYRDSEEKTILFVASFQDALMRWVIARGTCDPNDVTKAWKGWAAAPEDMSATKEILTDQGAQAIFDAWERMRIAANIGIVEASEGDMALLPTLLKRLPKLEETNRPRAVRLRRLMRFILEELEGIEPEEPAEPDAAATAAE